jgi:hypothetical protein
LNGERVVEKETENKERKSSAWPSLQPLDSLWRYILPSFEALHLEKAKNLPKKRKKERECVDV